MQFKDISEQKLFPSLIVRGWKYRRRGENIVTIFSPRGEDIVGVKISSHTGSIYTSKTNLGVENWIQPVRLFVHPSGRPTGRP